VTWWRFDEGVGPSTADFVRGVIGPLPPGVLWTRGISRAALLRLEVSVHGVELEVTLDERAV